jgi:hypothetical protein
MTPIDPERAKDFDATRQSIVDRERLEAAWAHVDSCEDCQKWLAEREADG